VLVGATLATALFGTAPAEARCWWNGYRRVCDRWVAPPPPPVWPRYPGWEQHRWCYYHPYRCR